MSKKYTKVKGYYDNGLWGINRVRDAVVKEWITADEFLEITAQDYEEVQNEQNI